MTAVAHRAIPRASAATSVDDDLAVYQAPTRPSRVVHCSAGVVFPYPAGPTSVRMRALDPSRSANRRGRSTILRLRSRTSETVAVVARPLLTEVTSVDVATLPPSL